MPPWSSGKTSSINLTCDLKRVSVLSYNVSLGRRICDPSPRVNTSAAEDTIFGCGQGFESLLIHVKKTGSGDYGLSIIYSDRDKEEIWFKTPELRQKAEKIFAEDVAGVLVVRPIGKPDY